MESIQKNDHDLLIRLDEKVDGIHKKIDSITLDHEKRIRDLENTLNEGKGKERVIQGFVSALVSAIIGYATHKL